MTYEFVPTESLDEYDDDGTMVDNVARLANNIVGRKIVSVEMEKFKEYEWRTYESSRLRITLDTGVSVYLAGGSDCCAYTELEAFLLHANKIDHIITGVRTEGGYTKWSIFADAGDVLELTVGWSAGNPFYYGYGFDITVEASSE